MLFCSLIKGITLKIRMSCFCPNKQHSFESFMRFVQPSLFSFFVVGGGGGGGVSF